MATGLAGATVLLVDDDPVVVSALSMLQQQWGCEVITPRSLDTAVMVVDQAGGGVQLIVTDFYLGGDLAGLGVIDAVRARLGRPVPALPVSGDTAPELLREAGSVGYPLLHKPVAPNTLPATLRQPLRA